VLVDGVSVGSVTSYTFTNVQADHDIYATFEICILVTWGDGGKIVIQDGLTAIMVPDSGYEVDEVTVNDVSMGSVAIYTFSDECGCGNVVGRSDRADDDDWWPTTDPDGDDDDDDADIGDDDDDADTCQGCCSSHGGVICVNGVTMCADGELLSEICEDKGCDACTDIGDDDDDDDDNDDDDSAWSGKCSIHATFKTSPVTVVPVSETEALVSVTENDDNTRTITAFLKAGYAVEDVLVDGVAKGEAAMQCDGLQCSYTTSDDAEHSIEIKLRKVRTITATAGANGSIDPAGDVIVNEGANQSFTITPDEGYQVTVVTVDGASVDVVDNIYTFENVTANHTIDVTFGIIPGNYTITATAGANGSIDPAGPVIVVEGTDKTFTITPDTGYSILDVTVDGSSVGAVDSFTFENVTTDHTIAATFATGGFTITATAGYGGSISPTGEVVVAEGGSQTFTMQADTDYRLTNVTVDNVSQGAITSYTFENVDADHTIDATFEVIPPDEYLITTTAQGNGSISPSSVYVTEGNSQTFSFIPAECYELTDVRVDGSSVGTSPSYTFESVFESHSITAEFTMMADCHSITVTYEASQGSVNISSGAVSEGPQTISIVPAPGYRVADLVIDGISKGAVEEYTLDVVADHDINVLFELKDDEVVYYTIRATSGDNGIIDPSGDDIQVAEGGNQQFTMNPDDGYVVDDVLVDGDSVGVVTTYTFAGVNEDHTIHVTFARSDVYTIEASAGTGGNITPSGTVSVNHGDNQTFIITPDVGYQVEDVVLDGTTSLGSVLAYAFKDVTENHTIRATFKPVPVYTISASAGNNGSIDPEGAVEVTQGDNQTFVILPSQGYQVEDVLVDDISEGARAIYPFTNVTGDHTIRATFVGIDPLFHTITATSGAGGSIAPSGSVMVNEGGSMIFVMVPDVGYYPADVIVDGSSKGSAGAYAFKDVSDDATIRAVFKREYTIDYDEDGDGAYEAKILLQMGENASSAHGLRSVCPCEIDVTSGKPGNMSMGLIGFELDVEEGDTAEVVITSSVDMPDGAKWYMFDEEAEEWSESSVAEFNNDGTITLTLTDGGSGDADGEENGWIVVNPSGFGIAVVSDDEGAGDDNCFISSATNAGSGFGVNPLMLMLTALIAGSAVFFVRKVRK
jgi:hypothetical protein